MQQRRRRGDIAPIRFQHDAAYLLKQYKDRGVPVKVKTPHWSPSKIHQALARGPHKSCIEYTDFLEEEFVDMILKGQWIVLPFEDVKNLSGLRLSPPGVVPQRGRRPRWIVDYSYYGVNKDTLPLIKEESMQFGHALDRLLREILLAAPTNGYTEMLKVDLSDGFYRINLNIEDIPKLGVVFPSSDPNKKLVALPLVLPMGWKNSPPAFCTATETAADLANRNLQNALHKPAQHSLDLAAAKLDSIFQSQANTSSQTPALFSNQANPNQSQPKYSTSTPSIRDPSLPSKAQHLQYIDVFVDDFIALCQGTNNRSRVRSTLLHAIDSVFRPNDFYDDDFRREPVSLKKLRQGDCSWSTVKTVLGWIIDTVAMTIQLPPHRQERLGEILASLPASQKRIGVTKWHQILGELRSMSLALPGARNMFSTMQEALTHKRKGTRIQLNKGVHQALDDFRWMLADINSRPTRIAEVVPLSPSAIGYHDASGLGAGGVWFPGYLIPRGTKLNTPLLWRIQWPQDITDNLISFANPNGKITNSDLELAGGLLHLDVIARSFDTRERTLLSKTDNLATLFWQRKGSATANNATSQLLRLFGIHQRYHRYVPRHDYISGTSNPLADDASRLFHLTDAQLLTYFSTTYPQKEPFRLATVSPQLLSGVISALRNKPSKVESLLVEPLPPAPNSNCGAPTVTKWAKTPFSKPSKTKYRSYKSSSTEFVPDHLQPKEIQSGLERLKITYGALHRRSLNWVSKTHV